MRYNLSYEANGKRVELKNITPEQVQMFLEKLERKDESSLYIKKVDDREERKMSEELKINIPVFNENEEAELENKLLFHLDEFTSEIMKTMTKDNV